MEDLEEAARLRAMAMECRGVARRMSLRENARLLEEMAERYEAQARALDARAKSPERDTSKT